MGRGLSDLQKAILRLAYHNRAGDDEPRPDAYRVTVCRMARVWEGHRPRHVPVDLRHLVPEAFAVWPDGYWRGQSVIAGSFPTATEADAFAAELAPRGADELPTSGAGERERRGLATVLWIERVRRAFTLADLDAGEYHRKVLPDLYNGEVLAACYGFPLLPTAGPRPIPGFPEARHSRCWWGQLNRPGRFDKQAIPPGRYDAAYVATNRALHRLHDRGLLDVADLPAYRHTALNLTDRGLAVAAELCANG